MTYFSYASVYCRYYFNARRYCVYRFEWNPRKKRISEVYWRGPALNNTDVLMFKALRKKNRQDMWESIEALVRWSNISFQKPPGNIEWAWSE